MARVSGIISAGLSSATDFTKPENRRQAVAQAVDARSARQTRTDTAGLPPDWLPTTAAGAGFGWLFGPIGALIGAGIVGTLSKRRREGIAAYASQEAEATEGALERARTAIDSTFELAQSDQERAEIKALRDEFETYATASLHPDPNVRAQALMQALSVAGTMDSELEEFQAERQRIMDETLAREEREFNRYDNLQGDMQRESARFIAADETWNKALLAYENPNPQSDMALVYLTAQMIDPGAIVTDGDSTMIKQTGTLSQQMAGYLNSLIDGTAGFDEEVRDGLLSVIAENYQVSRTKQMDTNAKYQELGQEARLGGAYLKNLRVPVNVEDGQRIHQFRQFRPKNAGIPYEGNPEALQEQPRGAVASEVASFGRKATEVAAGLGRAARGETLLTGQDGTRVIRTESGELLELEPRDYYEDENGGQYRRVDRGGGRFEWVPIKQPDKPVGPRTRSGKVRRPVND